MKAISRFLLLPIILIPSILIAKEVPVGTIEISGDLDISVTSFETKTEGTDNTDTDTQAVSASFLYYPLNNIGIGLAWEYESSESVTNGSKYEQTVNLIGPGVSFHFSVNDNLNIKLIGAIAKSAAEFSSNGSTTEADGFAWVISGGIAYFVTESVSLDASVRYLSISQEIDSDSTDIDSSGLATGLGLSVYLY